MKDEFIQPRLTEESGQTVATDVSSFTIRGKITLMIRFSSLPVSEKLNMALITSSLIRCVMGPIN